MLYDNFTASSFTVFGWSINGTNKVSDSFVLSQTSIVTGVNFGVLQGLGHLMVSVDYGITTVPNTYPVTGTALVTSRPTFASCCGTVGSINSFSTVPTLLKRPLW